MKNKKYKLNPKFKLMFIFLLSLFFVGIFYGTVSLARFVYVEIKDYYLETKNFYFNSDKMNNPKAIYQIDNWTGVDRFDVTFVMNSSKNNLVHTTTDVNYQIAYTCSSNITCTSTKNSGTIPASTHQDIFQVTIIPLNQLQENDVVWIDVVATSVSPYTKTISGRVSLVVGIPGLSYEIEDEAYRPYLLFNITNTLDFYTVKEAFLTYNVGDRIDINEYLSLSSTNKAKCASAIITLQFDPNFVLMDLTSDYYLNATNYNTTQIGTYNYISTISFKVDAISSASIRFYKVNAMMDYTYPFTNNTPIIAFSVT